MENIQDMRKLTKKVQKYIDQYGLLAPGDGVLAALSGGADSVCLLSVLASLSEQNGWQVRAFHLHHGLRGAEADRDEAFARALCNRLQITFTAVRRDVAAYAAARKLSAEEAGRILRYEELEAYAAAWERETGCSVKIAVAHHLDDQAETILHHLLRGSGLRGLSGMHPALGRRIRPFLCLRRSEILKYLTAAGQGWCEDSTNASGEFMRNRIRTKVLPMMEELINPGAAEHICASGELFRQADEYLTEQAREIFAAAGHNGENQVSIDLSVFLKQKPVIQSYLVRLLLDEAAPGQRNLTERHFRKIMELTAGPAGKRCDLPGGLTAGQGYDTLWIKDRKKMPQSGESCIAAAVPAVWDPQKRPESTGGLFFHVFSAQKGKEIPKNQYTKWFDYDKIKGMLSVRTRQSGDFISLPGGGRKMVSRYMIDEKIPREERDRIVLLAEGDHILWIIGYRISEYYKITSQTKRILQVDKTEEKDDGGHDSGIVDGRRSEPEDK